MSGTMRALFFEDTRTLTLREVPIPEPGPEDVLVRVTYCGICGSDLSVYKSGAMAAPDRVLGHEISATVEDDPTGQWERGARVVVFPARACGECAWCRAGERRYCLNPIEGRWGGYAEYATYPPENLIPIPDGVSDQVASMADPLGVGVRAVEIADPAEGEIAFVSGLGTIGLSTVTALVAVGARVVGADPLPDRRDLGRALGCEATIDSTEDAYRVGVDLDPKGFRYAFECSGVQESLQEVWDACGYAGTVGVLGIPMMPVLLLRMTVREQRAFSISGPLPESMAAALEHVAADPAVGQIIKGAVPLAETAAAMDRLIDGADGPKLLVDPHA